VGLQPHDCLEFQKKDFLEKLRQEAQSNPKIVAIGEIGLDTYYPDTRLEDQLPCFEYFLQMAVELNLPVVIHVRNTHKEVYSLLKLYSQKGLQGVIHCFTGTLEESKEFLDIGFYISLSGIVTFKNAQELIKVAHYVPCDKLLLETDSPYLAPHPFRGKVNEPSFVTYVYEFVATIKNMSVEELANSVNIQAHNLFHKMPRVKPT